MREEGEWMELLILELHMDYYIYEQKGGYFFVDEERNQKLIKKNTWRGDAKQE